MKKHVMILIISVVVYVAVKYFIPYGVLLLYPLILMVTFFHEFGHAAFALLSGGDVHGIQINPNGSGFAQISGGIMPLVAMGGYVGSAIIGNLLLYIGIKGKRASRVVPWLLAMLLIFTGIYWYQRIFTSLILLLFAVLMMWLASKHPKQIVPVLIFIGSASVLYILEDFNNGPRSDLAMFTGILPLLPVMGWAIVWLVIVLGITWITLRSAFKHKRSA